MKKFRFQFLAAAALLVLAACSSTDESADVQTNAEPQPVSFGTYVNQGVTRAGTTGVIEAPATMNSAGGFGVFAYYTDNVEYNGNQIPNFMYNQKVTGSGTPLSWSYTPIKYWPNEYGNGANSDGVDMLSFFAYAPYVAVTPSTGQVTGDKTYGITALTRNTATGDPMVKYIVGLNSSNNQGVDLLWGIPQINKKRPTADEKVSFTFNHALARLQGSIRTDATIDAKSRVYVRSITITGFASRGMLNLNSTDANSPLWLSYDGTEPSFEGMTFNDGRKDGREGASDGAQSNEKNLWFNPDILENAGTYDNSSTFWPAGKNPGVTNPGVSLFKNDLFVIPGGNNEAADITIVYDVETADPNLSTKLSDGKTTGSSVENRITKTAVLGSGFRAGIIHKINITLGMKTVTFDIETIMGWNTTENSYPYLP